MKNKLIVDTSKSRAYILLTYNGKKEEVVLDEQVKVSENLLPVIDKLLSMLKIKLNDLDAFCVVIGPGSFTGIRVGIATIKAFATSLNIKVVAKNSFQVLDSLIEEGVFLLKCSNTSKYSAYYSNGKIRDIKVLTDSDLKEYLYEKNLYQLENEICCEMDSTVLNKYTSILDSYFDNCIENGDYISPEIIEPYYVQDSQAEIELRKKEKQNNGSN